MRIEASVVSISWIPSEAVDGVYRAPFDSGVSHYDEAPPDRLEGPDHLDTLQAADGFRFANELSAWIEVDGDRIVGFGQGGGCRLGSSTLAMGGRRVAISAVPFPELRADPIVGDDRVRFTQTVGGRTGLPFPRRVSRPPFVQLVAPPAWTTVEVTLHRDGSHQARLLAASPFPRHWLYGADGRLMAKSGTIDFRAWARNAFGRATPWGDPARADELGTVRVGELETELERRLSRQIMGGDVTIRRVPAGEAILRQGDRGDDLFLLLDGVVAVAVDGRVVAELGPGAVLGERSAVAGSGRTATVTGLTRCVLAQTGRDAALSADDVVELAAGHRREEGAVR